MRRLPKGGHSRRWTVKELQALRPDAKGDVLVDGDGLEGEVRVSTADHVSVHWRYGHRWEHKRRWHYCGTWPAATLESIRSERDRARDCVKRGIHPLEARDAERIQAQQQLAATVAEARRRETEELTLRALFETWIQDGVRRADGGAELKRSFGKDVLPALGNQAVKTIREHELREVLRAILKRGVPRMASRVHADLRQMFAWAEKRQPWRALMPDGNPMALVDMVLLLPAGVDPDEERDRVLGPDEIRELRDLLDKANQQYDSAPKGAKYQVDRPLKRESQLALWIALSTCCRIGELLQARWSDVDLTAGRWHIPAEATKTHTAWTVYLSPFAARRFIALHELSGSTGYCFPARNDDSGLKTHVDLKSVSKQVGDRQIRFKSRSRPLQRRRNDNSLVLSDGKHGDWTPHDLRRTAATMMQQLGVTPDVIDRCLNHVLAGGRVRRHYLHHDYAAETREAWLRLGERLEGLLGM